MKAQNEELTRRNQHLEAQLLAAAKEADHDEEETSSSSERLVVRISHVPESSLPEERTVNLQVTIRGECPMVDMVIRILEFLKQVENVNLISMETTTRRILESSPSTNRITFRLRIEVCKFN